jgi:hypothetical protein
MAIAGIELLHLVVLLGGVGRDGDRDRQRRGRSVDLGGASVDVAEARCNGEGGSLKRFAIAGMDAPSS